MSNKYTVFTSDADNEIVAMCDLQEANLWLSSEINLTHDAEDFKKLSQDEQSYIKKVLAYFAASDGIVGENLAVNFLQETENPEVKYFYYFQAMMEAVHAKTYSQMITTFVNNGEERKKIFDSINLDLATKKKADWAFKYMDQEGITPSERLIAFMAIEGIFFAGSFAAIFWLRDKGILSNSLGVANEYISRDETLHAEFAVLNYKKFHNNLSDTKIKEIIIEAVEIEKEFIRDALPIRLIGMNADLMCQYIEFVGDMWLDQLGVPKYYNVEQPLDFMKTIGHKRKDLFHEKTRTNYARQTTNKTLDFTQL